MLAAVVGTGVLGNEHGVASGKVVLLLFDADGALAGEDEEQAVERAGDFPEVPPAADLAVADV